MKFLSTITAAAMAVAIPLTAAHAGGLPPRGTPSGIRNIVIVPDAFADGSGWRIVHDNLWLKGYHVQVVQERFASLSDDVAATKAIIAQQDGPVLLVGHGYGGAVITAAGADDKVKALVYVAAVEPKKGESTSQLLASVPEPSNDIRKSDDGHLFIDARKFAADYAADLAFTRTNFMADTQVSPTVKAFGGRLPVAAWETKPSYAVIATDDHYISPDLQRSQSQRANSKVTELKTSHAVQMSQPEAVAAVIDQAATAAK
jgi:pimeloyl-ACP methyl ester carboxylesterase